jgi:hypothetical protein
MSGGRTRPPARPVRTRAGHHHGHGGRPGARLGSRPPRPTRRDGRPAPPVRSPGHPGRRGSRRSWSAAGPHRTPGPRCGHGPTQQLTRRRVPALEHGLELGHGCFAFQPQAVGAGAVPPARGLAVARQVRFVVGGQLAGVVLLPAHRELGEVGHHLAAPLPACVGASERTPGALLSSDDYGSSVEREAQGQVLWRVRVKVAGESGSCGRLWLW